LLIPFVAFVVLIGFGLKNGDLGPGEAAVYGVIWLVLLLCFLLIASVSLWAVVPTVILDIVLVVKVFGGDIAIR